MSAEEILKMRIMKHPEDEHLLKLYKYKIITVKITFNIRNPNYIWFNCYFNTRNPLSWIYLFFKSLKHGLKGFIKMFKMKWSRIKYSHYVSKGVEVNDND